MSEKNGDGRSVKQELKENLVNEPPIVFSASMSGYGDGTYLYHLGSDTIDKISEETFDELTYNKDKTRLIVKVKNNDFSGIAEYDWKKAEFIPIISIEEIQRSVGSSELHNDITGLNCFGVCKKGKYRIDGSMYFTVDLPHSTIK